MIWQNVDDWTFENLDGKQTDRLILNSGKFKQQKLKIKKWESLF